MKPREKNLELLKTLHQCYNNNVTNVQSYKVKRRNLDEIR